jgi:hypothetical protein
VREREDHGDAFLRPICIFEQLSHYNGKANLILIMILRERDIKGTLFK